MARIIGLTLGVAGAFAPTYETAVSTLAVPGLHRGICVGTHADGVCTDLLPRSVLAVAPAPDDGGGAARFPLLSFSHGDFGGGVATSAYLPLLAEIASFGVVVLAHRSCNPTCGDAQYEDQLRVLDFAAAQNASGAARAAPALARVDFSLPFAVAGHSTGGRATLQSAAVARAHRVGAACGVHPDPEGAAANASAPTLVLTGSKDTIEPAGSARADFDLLPSAVPRAFADLENATHMSPVDGGEAPYARFVAAWVRAWVAGDADARAVIYGDASDALCGGDVPTVDCVVKPAR